MPPRNPSAPAGGKPRVARKPAPSGFRCAGCGEWHEELLTDVGCGLPDAVFALGYLERYRRARHNADFCTLDGTRHFIRCVLPVPFAYRDDFFGWGVWVEVEQAAHDAWLHCFDGGAERMPPVTGLLANALKAYRATTGLPVRLDFADDRRPFAWIAPRSRHALALEQRRGIDEARHHALADLFR